MSEWCLATEQKRRMFRSTNALKRHNGPFFLGRLNSATSTSPSRRSLARALVVPLHGPCLPSSAKKGAMAILDVAYRRIGSSDYHQCTLAQGAPCVRVRVLCSGNRVGPRRRVIAVGPVRKTPSSGARRECAPVRGTVRIPGLVSAVWRDSLACHGRAHPGSALSKHQAPPCVYAKPASVQRRDPCHSNTQRIAL